MNSEIADVSLQPTQQTQQLQSIRIEFEADAATRTAAASVPTEEGPALLPTDEAAQRPFLFHFIDRFLQEQNIKWILALGLLIVVAASIKLVETHWQGASAAWKHLILLGYTAAIFVSGQLSYWRLGLRRTGTVLMALTVLLIPIDFFGWHWLLAEQSVGFGGSIFGFFLLVANLALGWVAARRIFGHFLRATQPTFVAAYLLLSAAGGLLPAVPATWLPAVGAVLWGIFAAGTVKVNRHVFWLTEEHRLPRIFGFFPIALLGTQFLLLFGWQIGPHVPLDWLGLVCVLIAAPVMLAGDAVARVFQQRTGDLVRPYPWSVVLPLVVGLLLCAVGLTLAATGLPLPSALTPTAAIAAVLLGVTGHRTGRTGFVWGMLIALALAYNFSFVFFLDFARFMLNTGAAAVREQKLPYAFYGLTYLPLLFVATGAAVYLERRRAYTPRQSTELALFARPLRHFVVGLCGLWLTMSLTHPKATLPVAAVMTILFAVQTVLFHERRLVIATIVAFLAAAHGMTPFVETVVGWSTPDHFPFLCFAVAAILLLFPGLFVDRWLEGARIYLPVPDQNQPVRDSNGPGAPTGIEARDRPRWCRQFSLGVTLIEAAVWYAVVGSAGVPVRIGSCDFVLPILLALQAIIAARPVLGTVALCYAGGLALLHAILWQVPSATIVSVATETLLILWIASYGLARRRVLTRDEGHHSTTESNPFPLRRLELVPAVQEPATADSRLSRTFAGGCHGISLVLLPLLAAYDIVTLAASLTTAAVPSVWISCLLLVVWGFDAARRTRRAGFSVLASFLFLAWVGAAWSHLVAPDLAREWLAVVWSATALGGILSVSLWRRRLHRSDLKVESIRESHFTDEVPGSVSRAIGKPIEVLALAIVTVFATAGVIWFAWPIRLAGFLGVTGLLVHSLLSRKGKSREAAYILGNWQLFAGIFAWSFPALGSVAELTPPQLAMVAIPLAAAAAGSRWLLLRAVALPAGEAEFLKVHNHLLRLVMVASLGWLPFSPARDLSDWDAILSLLAYTAVAAELLREACRRNESGLVWMAEGTAAVAVLFFWKSGLVAIGQGLSMYAVLLVAILFWIAGRIAHSNPRGAILAEPFLRTGMALPLLTVAIGVGRHVLAAEPVWKGANSLALLLAAGFYFWRGLDGRDRRLLIFSIAILNIAALLLWRELSWSDPQFFMIPLGLSILGVVELLRREIPHSWLDPLRYAGALTILVSPTFHIVEGSWLHLATLMALAVAVTLLSIGLHVRALMYTGTAFLVADLVAMVVRGGIDRPNVLWIAGLALGSGVMLLGAICENHREAVLQRLRMLAAALATWN